MCLSYTIALSLIFQRRCQHGVSGPQWWRRAPDPFFLRESHQCRISMVKYHTCTASFTNSLDHFRGASEGQSIINPGRVLITRRCVKRLEISSIYPSLLPRPSSSPVHVPTVICDAMDHAQCGGPELKTLFSSDRNSGQVVLEFQYGWHREDLATRCTGLGAHGK